VNVYKDILKQNIHKILCLYDTSPFMKSEGFGDREYWAWKTKDFINGTLQGGVHALAIAIKLSLFNADEKSYVLRLIENVILTAKNIYDKNGALEEAYPQEKSFCVTALTAFDMLSAIQYLVDDLQSSKTELIAVIKPMIDYILTHFETHAIISNHLATAAAAICLWNKITGESRDYRKLLDVIYQHQSQEGWFLEYEGPDHGYQTLCTYYLSCIYLLTADDELLLRLQKSAEFLNYFIHPDGTIGGLYGARNTEVYYPGGIIALAEKIPEFSLLAYYLTPNDQHVLPQDIDIGNFIPLINSYAYAALHYESNEISIENVSTKKAFCQTNGQINFNDAGLFIFANDCYFAIINYKKGGVLKVFNKKTNCIDVEDGGIFGQLKNKKFFSTQLYDSKADFNDYTIHCYFHLVNTGFNTPFKTIILRLLALTLFRSNYLNERFKQKVVKLLMTKKQKLSGHVIRKFKLQNEKIIVDEIIVTPKNSVKIYRGKKSRAIHMASSGYFVKQNIHADTTSLVEFNRV